MESETLLDDERPEELSSIAAIYPEIKVDPSSPYRATLDIPVKPAAPLNICFYQYQEVGFPTVLTPPTSLDASEVGLGSKAKLDDQSTADTERDMHALTHLPPLNLEIVLPEGYPSTKPPIFKLSTNPPWLPQWAISKLLDDGKRLWEEFGRSLVVFSYIDHLQQLAETAFNIDEGLGGEIRLSRELKIALLDFNSKAEREKFEQETFECGICLEPKKGANCHRLLLCSHVFCVPCLQDFYNTCITEGDVEGVKCLAPDCGQEQPSPGLGQTKTRKKRDRTLSPSELLQIPLEQETVQRYVHLKRKRKLEADKTTVYCPRQWCQGAARSKKHPKPTDPMAEDPEDSDDEVGGPVFDPLGDEAQLPPMAERLSICEDCNYAFCCVCKKGWHGELVRCFPRREAELSAEEKATEEYLKLYTSACPTCDAPCQKQMGCNHMKCFKCDTHFCYLCSAWLSEDNPYQHFNTPGFRCYQRLWDLEGGDGINPDGAEALHRVPGEILFDNGDDSSEDEDVPQWEMDQEDIGPRNGRRPPPPAPVPPRANHIGNANRAVGGNANGLDAAARAAAAERQAQARAMAEIRAGRLAPERIEHARLGNAGLERFLELVQNDREDEWDSDELEDDF
ncbi:RBR-type E3 ubiquitin transferase [Aspergillus undulatus]|uniref:RBR-type E3 ubiquitin transferase n=1 Tax=Aspergillus undulatus TaxID=1810928 RepID=UPI003CCDCEA0